MNKKILLGLGATVAVIAGIAAFSAYEAHVINVTAHIENALAVSTKEIAFGTVFPQEYTEEQFTISLSSSFMAEDRVDDVDYVIKQKPKCVRTTLCPPVGVDPDCSYYMPVDYATHECPDGYVEMLDLCPFLSKIPFDEESGDYGVPSYYVNDQAGDFCTEIPAEPQHASGRLAKSEQDISDTWIVDLKVPPVEGYVGQDWPATCAEWVVPENEKDYGCDLWIEVTNISLTGGVPICGNGIIEGNEECDDGNSVPGDGCENDCTLTGICVAKPDVIQVFDRSGSIDSGELATMKTAAYAFVTALDPKADGAHMGQTSFADTGSLNLHLTDNHTAIDAAIAALVSGGYTNLSEGISLANGEFADPTYDRPDGESPDFMVIMTDGNPNRPLSGDPIALSEAAADAADNAGTIIYVLGIGSDVNATWLANNIATDPSHYFGVTNWADLEAALVALATCAP